MAKKAVKKSTEKKTKVVAIKGNTALAISDESFLNDAEEFSTKVDKDDVLIPRIAIIQKLSKVLIENEPDYLEDAEEGMFFDKSQDKLYDGDEGLIIVPVHYRKTHIEWAKRQFVADRGNVLEYINSCKRNEKKQLITPDGNTLVPTAEYAVLIIKDGEAQPAMISMTGMQMKKSKKLMTMISNYLVDSPRGKVNPAMFYRSYHFTTVPESNDEGHWFGFKIEIGDITPNLENGKDIYLMARAFRKQMDEGTVKVQSYEGTSGEEEGDDTPM